jgi:hypothetical protein
VKHYIRGNGSFGCLYDSMDVHETFTSAVETAQTLFDLTSSQTGKLARTRFLVLGSSYGADYVEIASCDCQTPEEHEG